MSVSLQLLGELALRDGTGRDLSLPTRKTRALLGYLAANANRPQPCERLMALLWSSFGEKQARHNLNQALLSLRKLGLPLDSDGERVTLRGDTMDIDLARFRACLDSNAAEAAALYDSPFLEGLTVPDPAFEDWLSTSRTELHIQACNALERAADAAAENNDTGAADAAAENNDTGAAVECARRLVALDPLREDAHRRLMRLLDDSGDRAGALRQYEACAEVLTKELQVEPDAATKALYEEIRNDTSPAAPKAPSPKSEVPVTETPAPLRDKPFIAVLPFDNMSDDQGQDFFADGITEDVITGLSRFPNLYVVDRNSIFAYKRRAADVRLVSQELGVRYVVQGSVRRSGEKVRVSVQLVDAETGNHIWAERYDRDMEDIFVLQDDITESVIGSTAPEITSAEWERKSRTRSDTVSAYDLALKAIWQIREGYFKSDSNLRNEGLKLANLVIARDPKCLEAWMALTTYYQMGIVMGPEIPRNEMLRRVQDAAGRLLELDPFDYRGLYRLGIAKVYLGRIEEGLNDLERAIKINPGDGEIYTVLAWNRARVGLLDEALEAAEQALRLSPRNPRVAGGANFCKAIIAYLRGHYEEATDFARDAIRMQPHGPMRYGILACSLLELGRASEARETIAELKRRRPEFVSQLLNGEYRVFRDDTENDRFVSTVRSLATMPEY